MKTTYAAITALSLLLAIGTASPSWAQTEDEHDAHHPEASEVVPGAGEPDAPGTSPGGMMGGMMPGMMMRGQMPGMMGGERQGMQGEEGTPGMARGQMMQGGMMDMCPMMQGMMQGQGMMGQGTMGGPGAGQGGLLYGIPGGQPAETTPETARAWLERQLEEHGNPRLRIGSVERQEDRSVIAEIETVDGSLVQRLAFNRYPGFVRQADD